MGEFILPWNVRQMSFLNLKEIKISTSRNWAGVASWSTSKNSQVNKMCFAMSPANLRETKDNGFLTWKRFPNAYKFRTSSAIYCVISLIAHKWLPSSIFQGSGSIERCHYYHDQEVIAQVGGLSLRKLQHQWALSIPRSIEVLWWISARLGQTNIGRNWALEVIQNRSTAYCDYLNVAVWILFAANLAIGSEPLFTITGLPNGVFIYLKHIKWMMQVLRWLLQGEENAGWMAFIYLISIEDEAVEETKFKKLLDARKWMKLENVPVSVMKDLDTYEWFCKIRYACGDRLESGENCRRSKKANQAKSRYWTWSSYGLSWRRQSIWTRIFLIGRPSSWIEL